MKYFFAILTFSFLAALLLGETTPADSLKNFPPVVTHTSPSPGQSDVDPDTTEIRITFSTDMLDDSYSFGHDTPDNYPERAGAPRYLSNHRTCIFPVHLQPHHAYALWINMPLPHTTAYFQSITQRSAIPYLITFATK